MWCLLLCLCLSPDDSLSICEEEEEEEEEVEEESIWWVTRAKCFSKQAYSCSWHSQSLLRKMFVHSSAIERHWVKHSCDQVLPHHLLWWMWM